MCKKEKYEKHRNVLVSFFASAMLVILNSQKLSLRTSSRRTRIFEAGGRTRTGDLLITNQLLYQLSHTSKHKRLYHKENAFAIPFLKFFEIYQIKSR